MREEQASDMLDSGKVVQSARFRETLWRSWVFSGAGIDSCARDVGLWH